MSRAHDPRPIFRCVETTVAVIVTAAVICLHVIVLLHAGGLWRDEVNSVSLAAMPSLAEMWANLRYTSIPALSLVVTRLWLAVVGPSDFGLRVLGFIVGMSIVAAFWFNAKALGFRFPLVSLLLLGFNATVIRWGDSIRPYGLGMLLALGTFTLMWRVVDAPNPMRILLAMIGAVLSVQCIYPNAFVILGLCLAGMAVAARRGQWQRCVLVAGIGLVAALSLLPNLVHLKAEREWAMVLQHQITVGSILGKVAEALGSPWPAMFWVWICLFALSVAGTLYLLLRFPNDKRTEIAVFAAVSMLTAAFGFFFGWIRTASYVTRPWNYLPLMAPVAISLDTILGMLTHLDIVQEARTIGVVILSALSFLPVWKEVCVRQTNVDVVAAVLEKSVTEHDLILVNHWFNGVSFQRYYHGRAPWMTLPPLEDVRIHRYDLIKRQIASENPMSPVLEKAAATLKSGHRVWVVGGLRFLQSGERLPTLAPAPHAGTWSDSPYSTLWSMQVGYFIQNHAENLGLVPVPVEGPVNRYENLPLLLAEGWR